MILDTQFAIDLLRGDRAALDLVAELEKSAATLRVPTIVFHELTEAWARSRTPARDFDRVIEVLEAQSVVALDAVHARRAGRLAADASAAGAPLDPLAAQVAAIALVEDEALVTRDVRRYGDINGLRLMTY